MRILIKESQLKRLIMEELGIAQEVVQTSQELYPHVVSFAQGELAKSLDVSDIPDEDFKTSVKESYGFFKTTVFGLPINIWVTKYEFPSRKLYDEFTQRYPNGLSYAYSGMIDLFKEKQLSLNITVVSVEKNLLTKNINSALQHELNHLYEQIHIGKRYADKPGYRNALCLMSDTNSNNLQKAIGQIIYYNGAGEIESFGNTLYGELSDRLRQYGNISREDLYSSYTYERVKQIEDAIQTIKREGNTPLLREIIKSSENNYRFCNLVRIGKSVVKEFRKTIGRVWIKFCKDYNLQP